MVQRSSRELAHDEPFQFQKRPQDGTRLDHILAELKARPSYQRAMNAEQPHNVTPLNTPFRAEVQTLQDSIDQLAHKVDSQRLAEAIAELSDRISALHADRSLGEPEMRLLRSIRRSLDDLIYQMNLVTPAAEAAPQPSQPLSEPAPVFGRRPLPPNPYSKSTRPQPGPIETPQLERRRTDFSRPAPLQEGWRTTGLIRRYPLASVAAAACFAIFLAQGLNQFAPRMSDITGSVRGSVGIPKQKPISEPDTRLTAPQTIAAAPARTDYPPPIAAVPAPTPVPQSVPALAPAPVPGRAADEIGIQPGALAAYQAGVRLAEGPARDYRAAMQMFEKAGDLPAAQFRLALLYERGQGAPKNANMARALYQKAAERGHVRAMHNLGVLYADGVDGRPDYAMAAEWFRRAAEYGLRDSEYNLATLTARGLGVEKRPANAYTWFALAALQGDAEAARQRDEIGKTLDTTSLKAAKAAVENFRPKQVDPSVNQTAAQP